MSTATPLPPPTSAAPVATSDPRSGPVAGHLTRPWQVATVVVWLATFAAFIGVWQASRQLGLSTWWRGPVGDPQPFVVTLIPFCSPAAMAIAALYHVRWLPWYGLVASVVTALIGLGDVGRVPRLGAIELALAAATALFSVASLSGCYRRARPE